MKDADRASGRSHQRLAEVKHWILSNDEDEYRVCVITAISSLHIQECLPKKTNSV